jgi:anthranilate phosphoribosyltransferase
MIKSALEQLINREDLTISRSFELMNEIMTGNVNNSHLAGLLIALKSKGETPEEIAGFAKAMRSNGIKVTVEDDNAIDVCGTGGDYSGTFNISTATTFAVAAAGVTVAKHGNRSVSSNSGSADVLVEMGVDINMEKEIAENALNKIGVAFLFAPNYHPAMKYAATVRKELGVKTIFNVLGPLTNPAQVKRQMIGAYNAEMAEKMARAAEFLDYEKVCFICSENKYDEILLNGKTEIFEYSSANGVRKFSVSNETFSYPKVDINEIKGNSAGQNAAIIDGLLKSGQKNGHFYVVAANAAFALYCAGYSDDLEECRKAAEDSILSGAAYRKFEELRNYSN